MTYPLRRRAVQIHALIVGMLLLGLAHPPPASADGDALHAASAGGLRFPEYLSVLEYLGEMSRADEQPATSHLYRALGLSLDIVVYDYGAADLADGIDSEQLEARYEQAIARMLSAQEGMGTQAERASLVAERIVTIGDASGRPAREAQLALSGAGPRGTRYLWFTALHGLLIEAQLDVAEGFEEDGRLGRGEILAELGRVLPASPQVVARARAAATQSNNVAVELVWDAETPEHESVLWVTYLYTRAAHAARESEARVRSGETVAAGEHEPSFEGELRARTMAVQVLRILRARDPSFTSTYFDQLERVEAAGFLREYVWHYLRRDSWEAPSGLDLAGFERWRASHLSEHAPQTRGAVTLRLASS